MLATPLFLLFQADLTFRIDTVGVNGSSPFGPAIAFKRLPELIPLSEGWFNTEFSTQVRL